MDALTLAVPSGRLFSDAVALLRRLGWLETMPDGRSLVVDGAAGFRMIITKPADVLTLVEHGAADAGITGKDILLEQERDVYELVDLAFGRCRGVVAMPPAVGEDLWGRPSLLRVATKYPRIASRYFAAQQRAVEVIELHGSVELAPRVGLADAILDVVMTGTTLRANRLVEVAEVFRSSARLVVNRVSLRTKAAAVRWIVGQMKGAEAR